MEKVCNHERAANHSKLLISFQLSFFLFKTCLNDIKVTKALLVLNDISASLYDNCHVQHILRCDILSCQEREKQLWYPWNDSAVPKFFHTRSTISSKHVFMFSKYTEAMHQIPSGSRHLKSTTVMNTLVFDEDCLWQPDISSIIQSYIQTFTAS